MKACLNLQTRISTRQRQNRQISAALLLVFNPCFQSVLVEQSKKCKLLIIGRKKHEKHSSESSWWSILVSQTHYSQTTYYSYILYKLLNNSLTSNIFKIHYLAGAQLRESKVLFSTTSYHLPCHIQLFYQASAGVVHNCISYGRSLPW